MRPDWRPAIRALLYCVQFSPDLSSAAGHAIKVVVDKRALGIERSEYHDAIAQALSSTEDLATLLPQPHSDDEIRGFLRSVRDALC
jgi:hypothetical protein